MSAMLLPTRFRLSEEQVVAALSLAKIHPTKRSMLPDLPRPAKPLPLLKDTGMLSEDGKKLNTEAEAALSITADPSHMLSVIGNNVDYDRWVETSFVHGQNDSAYVSLASDNKTYDFALLPTSTQAAVLIDDMLGLTAMISRPGGSRIKLGLAGYSAVLAMADVLQATRLQARLERARRPVPKLTAELLEEQLLKGLDNIDTRWAVTAGRMVCPSHVRMTQGNMSEGLEQLKQAGLVDGTSANGFTYTQDGFMLGSSLGQLVYTAGFSLVVGHKDDHLSIAHASLFRTTVAIWMVTWSSVSKQDAGAELFEASAAGAIGFIQNLLKPVNLPEPSEEDSAAVLAEEPVAASVPESPATPAESVAPTAKVCRYCGKKNTEDAMFCNGCGRELKKPDVTAVPPQAPASTPPKAARPEGLIDEQVEAINSDIEKHKFEMSKLEIRYKIGDLSEKQYRESEEKLLAQIQELEKNVEDLKKQV
jgi:hypothetical protein